MEETKLVSGEKKAPGRPKVEAVSKAEFEALKGNVTEMLDLMKQQMASKKQENPPTPAPKKLEQGEPDENTINPKWIAAKDEILGKDFGLSIRYPETGSYILTVSVPREKSNAPQAYWDFYKVDLRSKALSPAEGIEGVKAFFNLIKKNLERKQA